MQTQRGLRKDASLTKFVLGAHPIIEHFINLLRIRETIGTYVPADKRMRLDDDKALAILIHNILTTPNALYEMLVLGLNVTADGAVPISHQIYAGNQTDDRLHPENHKALQKLLRRTDFIYVADCKLATEENLRKIAT